MSERLKLYRPLSKDRSSKWGGNSNAEDIGGMAQLPKKGVLAFVTSSLKEVMLLHELGFPAICPNGETAIKSKNFLQSVEYLQNRFKYVVSLMDSDEAGLKSSTVLWENHRLPFITVPRLGGVKDLTDFRKTFGHKKTWTMLKKLLTKKFKLTNGTPF